MKTISWFSAGVSSAVATKLVIDDIDQIIYTHIDDQHEDSIRFVEDCEEWFGKEITILQSAYKTVEEACYGAGGKGYINGPGGAACTRRLKRMVRIEWEYNETEDLCYVWGMDSGEKDRIDQLRRNMPNQQHQFPLADSKIDKAHAHRILKASGIKRPKMYDLGFPNNNCRGCPKGGMGYWNRIREVWPDLFEARAKMERKIGASCINGVYLDELDPERGRFAPMIMDDCGIFCELEALI